MTEQLTIIASSNRPDAVSTRMAEHCKQLAQALGFGTQLLRMDQLPRGFVTDAWTGGSEAFNALVESYILPADRLIVVAPEYNGSYPGVFKAFIDAAPQPIWKGKKAGLIGVSSGRAGNLRGTDQLTNVLNYLKVSVYHQKPKFSGIDALLQPDGSFPEDISQALEGFLKEVMEF